MFLHNCVNVIWSLTRPKGPPLSVLLLAMWLKAKNRAITIDIWMSTEVGEYVFAQLCQCHLKFEKTKKPSPVSVLIIFLHQKISIILQRLQASCILSWAVVMNLTISWLPPLQIDLPSPWPTYCKWWIFYMEKDNRPTTIGRFWWFWLVV